LPAALTLLWSQQNWWAATLTPPLGLTVALIAWLVTAKKEGGTLTVATTGANNPMLAGNVAALLAPCIFIPILTYALGKENYDWVSMKEIKKADDHDISAAAHIDLEMVPGGHNETTAEEEAEQAMLMKAARTARWLTVFLTLALLVLWPVSPAIAFIEFLSNIVLDAHVRQQVRLLQAILPWLGHHRHPVDVLLRFLCRTVPTLGGSPHHEENCHCYLQRCHWQEEASCWSYHTWSRD
jgi:hypothetical protein